MSYSNTKKSCLALPEVFYANLPNSLHSGDSDNHHYRHCCNPTCLSDSSQIIYPHMAKLESINYLPNNNDNNIVTEHSDDDKDEGKINKQYPSNNNNKSMITSIDSANNNNNNNSSAPISAVDFEFCCQLAEGSATYFVSNFSSMIELYEKVAECFDISSKEIMYCTLNTAKVDMDQILGGQIGLDDIIFVHRKGTEKHVEVKKSEKFLGLTIADNGNGCSYIKKIKQDSTASRVPFIKMGDHIESIMDQSMVGCRHYEVAHFLKNIPLDTIFTITLIEPFSSGFQQLSPRRKQKYPTLENGVNNGKGTLRIRDNLMVDQDSPSNQKIQTGLSYINRQLEKFIGINDDELAEELWRLAVDKNPHQFALSIEQSDLNDFKFSKDFIFDVWAIVDDVAHQRLAL